MKGLHLVEVFEDPGISGGKPLASRPAGSQLLAAANKSKVLVIVAKLDRLFRSVADAANVIADIEKKGIRLIAMRTDILPNPAGVGFAPVVSCR
jgi:DNA invertase Pin-like site-specific DNA recombinase